MFSKQLESYFPPAAPTGTATREEATAGSRNVLRTAGGDHPIRSLPARKKKQKQGTSSSDIPIDEEDMQTAVVLNNRDLEIYVTLPSAEKRLFVDVQEEIAVPSISSHKAKKRKVGHHAADGKKELGKKVKEGQVEEGGKKEREKGKGKGKSASTSTPSALASKDPNAAKGQSSAASSSKPTASKDAKENKSASASSKIMTSKSTTTEKGKQTEIASASDKLTDPTASGALVPATSISPDSEDDDVINSLLRRPGTSNEKDQNITTSANVKPQEKSRLPYSSFEHVKLNVRVRPPTSGSYKKRKNSDSSGVDISAIDRKIGKRFLLHHFANCSSSR